MPMETYIKENGRTEKPMELEFLLILMDPCMKANGKMINSMDTAQNLGTITKSNSLENSQKARKQEKVDLSSKAVTMKVISQMANSMGSESITSQIPVDFMKVNLKTIIWKEKEL